MDRMDSAMEVIGMEDSVQDPIQQYSVQTTAEGLMIVVERIGTTNGADNLCSSEDGRELTENLQFITVGNVNPDVVEVEHLIEGDPSYEIDSMGLEAGTTVVTKSRSTESIVFNTDVFLNETQIETDQMDTDVIGGIAEASFIQPEPVQSIKARPPLKEKPWPLTKTKALMSLMRKHQSKFKRGNKTRKLIWSEISQEMEKKAYTHCDRDECAKKWDNLYRTYKTVQVRDGKKATWELYVAVKELVKVLNWPNPSAASRKIQSNFEAHPPDLNLMMKVILHHHTKRTAGITSFTQSINNLNEERDKLINCIGNCFASEQLKSKSRKDIVIETSKPAVQNTNHQLQDVIENQESGDNLADPSSSIVNIPFQMNLPAPSGELGDGLSGSGFYYLRLIADDTTGNPVYELVEIPPGEIDSQVSS